MTHKFTKSANGDDIFLCNTCETELATIKIPVDGDNLLMQSCDKCDKRSWELAGKEIDLQDALSEVRDHVSKRGK